MLTQCFLNITKLKMSHIVFSVAKVWNCTLLNIECSNTCQYGRMDRNKPTCNKRRMKCNHDEWRIEKCACIWHIKKVECVSASQSIEMVMAYPDHWYRSIEMKVNDNDLRLLGSICSIMGVTRTCFNTCNPNLVMFWWFNVLKCWHNTNDV